MPAHIYEKGTVKVVWIENREDLIFSRMFNSVADAVSFAAHKPDCLVFSLVSQQDMTDFTWQLLPHGRHRVYSRLFRSYKKIPGQFLNLLV